MTPPLPRNDRRFVDPPRSRPLTVVLHIVPGAAIEGRLAGRVEVVDTGETLPIRSTDELLELIARIARDRDIDSGL